MATATYELDLDELPVTPGPLVALYIRQCPFGEHTIMDLIIFYYVVKDIDDLKAIKLSFLDGGRAVVLEEPMFASFMRKPRALADATAAASNGRLRNSTRQLNIATGRLVAGRQTKLDRTMRSVYELPRRCVLPQENGNDPVAAVGDIPPILRTFPAGAEVAPSLNKSGELLVWVVMVEGTRDAVETPQTVMNVAQLLEDMHVGSNPGMHEG